MGLQSGTTIDRTQSLTAREAGICSLVLCTGEKETGFSEYPESSATLVLHHELNSLHGTGCSHFEGKVRTRLTKGSTCSWPIACTTFSRIARTP